MIDHIRRSLVRRYTRMMMPFKYEYMNWPWCWCGGSLAPRDTTWRGLEECPECGTWMLVHRLTPKSTHRFYESGDYRRYVRGTSQIGYSDFVRGVRRGIDVAAYLRLHGVRPKTAVEVGCGPGGILASLRNEFRCRVAGVDEDRRCVSFASGQGLRVETRWDSIADDFRHPNLIVLSHLLEHVIYPLDGLTSYGEISDWVYVETPVWTVNTIPQIGHLWYFTPASIRLMASCANLEIVAMDDSIRAILRRKNA